MYTLLLRSALISSLSLESPWLVWIGNPWVIIVHNCSRMLRTYRSDVRWSMFFSWRMLILVIVLTRMVCTARHYWYMYVLHVSIDVHKKLWGMMVWYGEYFLDKKMLMSVTSGQNHVCRSQKQYGLVEKVWNITTGCVCVCAWRQHCNVFNSPKVRSLNNQFFPYSCNCCVPTCTPKYTQTCRQTSDVSQCVPEWYDLTIYLCTYLPHYLNIRSPIFEHCFPPVFGVKG